MKTKIIAASVLVAVLYSCAAKQATPPPVIAPSPEELKVTQIAPPVPKATVEIVGPLIPAEEIAQGKTLYENNCARCHRLFGPKEFTNEQWKPLVLSMQKNTPLNDFEIAKVLAYVTSENK